MRFSTKTIALLLCLAVLVAGCSSGQLYLYDEKGNPIKGEVLQEKEKSQVLGVLLTIFPGILWHGIGHRYAGDSTKAEEIEQFEVLSLIAGGAAVGLYYGAEEARRNDLEGTKLSLYVSSGTMAAFGSLGFFGTWIYDMIFTPAAVRRHNRRLYYDEKDMKKEQEDDIFKQDW